MVRLLTDAGAALARLPLVETFVAASVIAEKNLPALMSGELVITAALAEHPVHAWPPPLRLTGNRLNGITQLVPIRSAPTLVLVPAQPARTATECSRWSPCPRRASATR